MAKQSLGMCTNAKSLKPCRAGIENIVCTFCLGAEWLNVILVRLEKEGALSKVETCKLFRWCLITATTGKWRKYQNNKEIKSHDMKKS